MTTPMTHARFGELHNRALPGGSANGTDLMEALHEIERMGQRIADIRTRMAMDAEVSETARANAFADGAAAQSQEVLRLQYRVQRAEEIRNSALETADRHIAETSMLRDRVNQLLQEIAAQHAAQHDHQSVSAIHDALYVLIDALKGERDNLKMANDALGNSHMRLKNACRKLLYRAENAPPLEESNLRVLRMLVPPP